MSNVNAMTSMAITNATRGNLDAYQSQGKGKMNAQKTEEEKEAELREASQGFEAIFMQRMWEEMRSSMPENSMHGSKEEKYWQSMYSQHLGEDMAKNGGIGLADMMVEQMSKNRITSPSAMKMFDRAPMTVKPAPLFPEGSPLMGEKEHAVQNAKPLANTTQAVQNPTHVFTPQSSNVDFYESMDTHGEAILMDKVSASASTNTLAVTPAVAVNPVQNQMPQVTTTRTVTNSAGVSNTTITTRPLESVNQGQSAQFAQAVPALATGDNFDSEPAIAENYNQAIVSAAHEKVIAGAPANMAQSANISAQIESPAIRQTLDELRNKVEAQKAINAEPIVVRTRYVSNLPASERKGSILDRKGGVSSEHMQEIQAQITPQQVAREEAQRNAEKELKAAERAALRVQSTMTQNQAHDQGISDYPEELMGGQIPQVTKTEPRTVNIQSQLAQDPLLGINQRYVATSNASVLNPSLETSARSAQNFKSFAEIQSEINKLMTRENRSTYTMPQQNMNVMLASSTQINSTNPLMPHGMQNLNAKNTQETISPVNINIINQNLVAEAPVQVPAQVSAQVSAQISAQVPTPLNNIPVYHSMPSLDEALRSGSLIASLSPEELRASQMGTELNRKPENTKIFQVAQASTLNTNTITNDNIQEQKAAGGPEILHPSFILPENVSATSPIIPMQAPLEGAVHSSFGWRLDPISNQRAWHTGLDIQAKAGTSVKAAADGRVSFTGKDRDLGNIVIVDHSNGLQSVYGHTGELFVKEGEKITAGTNIATVGISGRTSGAHVHFEIRHNGLSINPEPYLSQTIKV